MMSSKFRKLLLIASLIVIILIIVIIIYTKQGSLDFNGIQAFDYLRYQVDLGPRTMGSAAHEKAADWIISTLIAMNWQVNTQETVINNQSIKNIIAKRRTTKPWIILASHYDSRLYADMDPKPANRKLPVLGANDGASSVAILLELARVIPDNLNKTIWLVFFDDEDNGTYSGNGWDVGSEYFVAKLQGKPDSVVVLDMVGDKDLKIYMEQNSDKIINTEIWDTAQKLGYQQFIPTIKYNLIDDHIPFIKAGIKAVDVIDFDYPYWHTRNDTLDKVSAESLKIVGETILKWIESYSN